MGISIRSALIFALIISIAFSACTRDGTMTESVKSNEKMKMRFGILPIEDTLPIFVAEQEGIFEEKGLDVEIVNFQSALERDSALTAGEIDGVITDPLAVILLKNSGYNLKIVSIGLGMEPEEGVFAILSSPDSDINTIQDLEGRKIAISTNTIIEYVTDVMLEESNVTAQKEAVKSIPIRMQMLTENSIDAATLPEPLASLAVMKGAKLIKSDADMDRSISQTVIVFNGGFIEEKKGSVNLFLEAYGEAVEKINENPDKYRETFIDIARVPEPLTETYQMPEYPAPQPFPEKFYNEVMEWAINKNLIEEQLPYEIVNENIFH